MNGHPTPGTLPDGDFRSLLTPENSALALIDYQPQPVFHIQSMDRELLVNNVTGLAKVARLFEVPTVMSTTRCFPTRSRSTARRC